MEIKSLNQGNRRREGGRGEGRSKGEQSRRKAGVIEKEKREGAE